MEDDDHNVNVQFSSMLPLFPQCSEDIVVDAEPISYCLPLPSSYSTISTADDFPFMSPTIHPDHDDDDVTNSCTTLSLFPQVLENPSNPNPSLFPDDSENPKKPTLSLFSQDSKTPKEHSLTLFPQVSDNTPTTTTTQSSMPPMSTDLCLSLPYTPESNHSSAKRSLFQESREEKFVPVKKLKVTKESINNFIGQRSIVAAGEEEGHWIIKTLTKSDVNGLSRLLLWSQDVKKYILPFMNQEQAAVVCSDLRGVNVTVYDMDTYTDHILTLKKWVTNSFILVKAWTSEFVKRRNLNEGDVVWIRWDKNNSRFCFRVAIKKLEFKLLS